MTTTNLGETPVCNEALALPLTADATGTWAFVSNFKGLYQYKQFQATAGQPVAVPVRLNEDYTYLIKLYKPDGSLFNNTQYSIKTIPMLPDIEYSCAPAPDGAGIVQIKTAKKQFIAADGQTAVGDNAFINALQALVFVEGMLRQEGAGAEDYSFNAATGAINFNTPLVEGQTITVLYFK